MTELQQHQHQQQCTAQRMSDAQNNAYIKLESCGAASTLTMKNEL
jgi:hypothetical protein